MDMGELHQATKKLRTQTLGDAGLSDCYEMHVKSHSVQTSSEGASEQVTTCLLDPLHSLRRANALSSRRLYIGYSVVSMSKTDLSCPELWPAEWSSLSELGTIALPRNLIRLALAEKDENHLEEKTTMHKIKHQGHERCTNLRELHRFDKEQRPRCDQGLFDFAPRLDFRVSQPVPTGYITHWLDDGTAMVQVDGPGLRAWEHLRVIARGPFKKV